MVNQKNSEKSLRLTYFILYCFGVLFTVKKQQQQQQNSRQHEEEEEISGKATARNTNYHLDLLRPGLRNHAKKRRSRDERRANGKKTRLSISANALLKEAN